MARPSFFSNGFYAHNVPIHQLAGGHGKLHIFPCSTSQCLGGGAVIGLLQRVQRAHVDVDGNRLAEIGRGLLVLIGVQQGDTENEAERLLERLLGYRVFEDADGRMNLNISQVKGALLLVPQFTLAADTRSGMRPGFSAAADPVTGQRLFAYMQQSAQQGPIDVCSGEFGANMQVSLVNDGPVRSWLEVKPRQ